MAGLSRRGLACGMTRRPPTTAVSAACPRLLQSCVGWPRLGPVALQGAVDGGAGDAEQVGELGGAVVALPVEVHQMGFLSGVELGLLTAQLPLALATRMPSRVRRRMRSDSNSATAGRQRLAQPGALPVCAGQPVIDVDASRANPERQ